MKFNRKVELTREIKELKMSLTIIRPARFKAMEEWEQKLELEKNGDETHFYRKLSFSKKAFGLGLGHLDFKVELKTNAKNHPNVYVKSESMERFIDFKIMIEYSSGGKSESFECSLVKRKFNDYKFYTHSKCPVFKDIFKANVEINVTYKVAFELELKKIEMPLMKPNLLHKLHSNGEFSDVKIHCDGKVFNCHKLILRGWISKNLNIGTPLKI